jgi:hypothetical protein
MKRLCDQKRGHKMDPTIQIYDEMIHELKRYCERVKGRQAEMEREDRAHEEYIARLKALLVPREPKPIQQKSDFATFFDTVFEIKEGAPPIDIKTVRSSFRTWKQANMGCKIKQCELGDLMRYHCKGTSTTIFPNVIVKMDASNAAFLSHMP